MPKEPNRTARIEETKSIRLSVEDQQAFAKAMMNPPVPNDALKRAGVAHRDLLSRENGEK